MQISKICVQNFRLLKHFSIDIEKELSVIIGKNNCGKTSLLLILDKFIGAYRNKAPFTFDDFNIDFKELIKKSADSNPASPDPKIFEGLSLKLFITYDENDNLANISEKVMMDLDPDNRNIVLLFKYSITEEKLQKLFNDNKTYNQQRTKEKKRTKDILTYLKDKHTDYFHITKRSLFYDIEKNEEDENTYTDLIKEKVTLDDIINFKWISARRDVSNKDTECTLSSQSSKIYKKLDDNSNNTDVIEKFKDTLVDTDEKLDDIYSELFEDIINDVKQFGGVKENESIIKIISSLQHKELFEENTTVIYGHDSASHTLPENYNGLGYMNLISMIFEIRIILQQFERDKDKKPADINLLFIEEPEVHTHPQMQRIFIKNIKSLIEKGIKSNGSNKKLQTLLSSHSPHIASESNFEDIKYFKKVSDGIISKNLKDLEREYKDFDAYYKFIKQYLTLHRSELFFADKAVFIEGDTERILLHSIMKKIDQEDFVIEAQEGKQLSTPLLSQNISIIEVGAYAQIFEKFINFIGIKGLIITDIDSCDADNEACQVANGLNTSNSSLKFFFGSEVNLDYLIKLNRESKILKCDPLTKEWEPDAGGNLLCVYQISEKNNQGDEYHARSFEDSFFHINYDFINLTSRNEDGDFNTKNSFKNLKNTHLQQFLDDKDAYTLATEGVKKKPSLAMEILLNSISKEEKFIDKNTSDEKLIVKEYSNWETPLYIKEGLSWLKLD